MSHHHKFSSVLNLDKVAKNQHSNISIRINDATHIHYDKSKVCKWRSHRITTHSHSYTENVCFKGIVWSCHINIWRSTVEVVCVMRWYVEKGHGCGMLLIFCFRTSRVFSSNVYCITNSLTRLLLWNVLRFRSVPHNKRWSQLIHPV